MFSVLWGIYPGLDLLSHLALLYLFLRTFDIMDISQTSRAGKLYFHKVLQKNLEELTGPNPLILGNQKLSQGSGTC